jgi:hypothetical protein
MPETKPLKKMSTATVMEVARGTALEAPTVHTGLYAVFGIVSGTAPAPTQFDKNGVVLIGRFKAVRAKDRQVFTAEKLYLPDSTYQKQMAAAVKADEQGEVHPVRFGFNVGFAPMPSSPTGYNFTCTPMLDVAEQDALAEIEHQIDLDKFLPKLAAPAAPEEKKVAAIGGAKK